MLIKRSSSFVPLLFCLSLFIGCSGDNKPAPTASGEPEKENLGNAVDQVAEKAPDKPEITRHEVMKPAANSLDLTYITDDFTSAIIAHPARVLNSEFVGELVKAGVPLDDVLKQPTDEIGADPRQIEQVVLLFDKQTMALAPEMMAIPGTEETYPAVGPAEDIRDGAVPEGGAPENRNQGALDNSSKTLQPVAFQPAGAVEGGAIEAEFGPETSAPPEPTVIMRFSVDIDSNEFFEHMNEFYRSVDNPLLKDVEIDGLKAKQPPFSDAVFHFVNSRTLIHTQPQYLKKMVDTKSAQSDLLTELKSIDPTHDLILVADLTPLRPQLQEASQMLAAFIPPDLAALGKISTNTKMVTLTAGISNNSLLSATFVMDSADDAQAVDAALTDGLKQAQGMYEQQKAEGLAAGVPLDEAAQKEVIAAADEIVAGLSHQADGNRLTISIPKPGNLNKLAGLMSPLIQNAWEEGQKAAAQSEKESQLMLIALGLHNYHDLHTALPGAGSDADGQSKGLSWRVYILPFIDEIELYRKFNLDEPWDSAHNKALISEMPDVFKTPEVTAEGKTVFQVVVGENTAFQMEKGRRFGEFKDGLSNTILAVETSPDKAEIWTKPGGLTFNEADPVATFGNANENLQKFLILLADATVHEFSVFTEVAQPGTLKALITPNGGETVEDF